MLIIKEAKVEILPYKEYLWRLKQVGFNIGEPNSQHHRTNSHPAGISETSGEHNWHLPNSGADKKRQDFRKGLASHGLDPNTLDFIFENPFVIPANLNLKTLKYNKPKDSYIVKVTPDLDLNELNGKEIKVQGLWKKIEIADHDYIRSQIDFIFKDNSVVSFRYGTNLEIKN